MSAWTPERIETLYSKLRAIVVISARDHGVRTSEVMSRRRNPKIVSARHDAILAVKETYPQLSTTQIGRFFGRDHTTIVYVLNGKRRLPKPESGNRRVELPMWIPKDLVEEYVEALKAFGEFGAASHCRKLKREMEAGA